MKLLCCVCTCRCNSEVGLEHHFDANVGLSNDFSNWNDVRGAPFPSASGYQSHLIQQSSLGNGKAIRLPGTMGAGFSVNNAYDPTGTDELTMLLLSKANTNQPQLLDQQLTEVAGEGPESMFFCQSSPALIHCKGNTLFFFAHKPFSTSYDHD